MEETEDQNGVAPYLPLPRRGTATWRRCRRSCGTRSSGRPASSRRRPDRIAIVTATERPCSPLLDRFVELHRMSEGPKGVFMVPGMEIFFRRLGEAFCADGIVPADLHRGGRTAGGRHDRVRVRGRRRSCTTRRSIARGGTWRPGMVLVGEDIRMAIEDGCAGFDLLKGDYQYKYRFGAHPRAVKRCWSPALTPGQSSGRSARWRTWSVGAVSVMRSKASRFDRGHEPAVAVTVTIDRDGPGVHRPAVGRLQRGGRLTRDPRGPDEHHAPTIDRRGSRRPRRCLRAAVPRWTSAHRRGTPRHPASAGGSVALGAVRGQLGTTCLHRAHARPPTTSSTAAIAAATSSFVGRGRCSGRSSRSRHSSCRTGEPGPGGRVAAAVVDGASERREPVAEFVHLRRHPAHPRRC